MILRSILIFAMYFAGAVCTAQPTCPCNDVLNRKIRWEVLNSNFVLLDCGVVEPDAAINLTSINDTMRYLNIYSCPVAPGQMANLGPVALDGSLPGTSVLYVSIGTAAFPNDANLGQRTPAVHNFAGLTASSSIRNKIKLAGC